MRPALLLISIFFLPLTIQAQLDESLVRRFRVQAPTCVELLYTAQKLLPRYYEASKRDSVTEVLVQLKAQCKEGATTQLADVILHISKDSLAIDTTDQLLQNLISYKEDRDFVLKNTELVLRPGYYDYYEDWGEVMVRYYAFVETIAIDMLAQPGLNPLERDLLRFYAGDYDELLTRLKRNKYTGTKLQEDYKEQVSALVQDEGVMIAPFVGYWMPTDNLARLGNHPELGFQVGYFNGRMKYGLMLAIRFVNAPEPYRYRENDSNYVTDEYSALQVGGEIGYALYKGARNEVDLNLGLAYDGITVVPGDDEAGIDPVGAASVNVNMGLEYRVYYNLRNFISLDARYHFLNYKNNINSELYGNALTLRLTWGFTSSYERKNKLHALGY